MIQRICLNKHCACPQCWWCNHDGTNTNKNKTACEHHICCTLFDPVIAYNLWKRKSRAFLHQATKSNADSYLIAAVLSQSCHSVKTTHKTCIFEIANKNKQIPLFCAITPSTRILLLRLRFAATILAQSTPWCCSASYRISACRLSWHLPLPCIIVVRHRFCLLPLKAKWRLYIVHTHEEIMVFKGALFKFSTTFWTHTPQNMHFTTCGKFEEVWSSFYNYDI